MVDDGGSSSRLAVFASEAFASLRLRLTDGDQWQPPDLLLLFSASYAGGHRVLPCKTNWYSGTIRMLSMPTV